MAVRTRVVGRRILVVVVVRFSPVAVSVTVVTVRVVMVVIESWVTVVERKGGCSEGDPVVVAAVVF